MRLRLPVFLFVLAVAPPAFGEKCAPVPESSPIAKEILAITDVKHAWIEPSGGATLLAAGLNARLGLKLKTKQTAASILRTTRGRNESTFLILSGAARDLGYQATTLQPADAQDPLANPQAVLITIDADREFTLLFRHDAQRVYFIYSGGAVCSLEMAEYRAKFQGAPMLLIGAP